MQQLGKQFFITLEETSFSLFYSQRSFAKIMKKQKKTIRFTEEKERPSSFEKSGTSYNAKDCQQKRTFQQRVKIFFLHCADETAAIYVSKILKKARADGSVDRRNVSRLTSCEFWCYTKGKKFSDQFRISEYCPF